MTDKTKEEIMTGIDQSNCPHVRGVYEAMQVYADQEKRKEAMSFSEWIGGHRYSFYWSNGLPRWYPTDAIIGVIPKPSYSNEEIYDLYLQSQHTSKTISNDQVKAEAGEIN